MAKPYNVISKTAMIAALTASSLMPAAVQASEVKDVATTIEDTIFTYDDKEFLSIPFDEYREAVSADVISPEGYKYIKADNGKYYSFEDYREAVSAFDTLEEAFNVLEPVNLDAVKEGMIDVDSKKVVAKDEQPEDRLNETFFYNVA